MGQVFSFSRGSTYGAWKAATHNLPSGNISAAHRDEILGRVRHIEQAERSQH
jgi:hypothetical protein